MADSEIVRKNAPPDLPDKIRKADRKGAILVSLPKWIAWAVIAWQIRLSIEVLAGEYAFPSLLSRFWRQASVWEVVCWSAGLLGLMLGLYYRHLLHRQVTQDLSRLNSIEKRLGNLIAHSGRSAAADDRSPQ
jgi:hypothetical protein